MSLRFPIALALSIVCLAVPAWADFQEGVDTLTRGDFATALREWRPLATLGGSLLKKFNGWIIAPSSFLLHTEASRPQKARTE